MVQLLYQLYRNTGNLTFEAIPNEVSGLWYVEGTHVVRADVSTMETDLFGELGEEKISYLFINDEGKFRKEARRGNQCNGTRPWGLS